MSIKTDKYKVEVSRTGFYSVVINIILRISWELIAFFTFTNEDRTKAGINWGDNGRDG
jgi:hypothetical protein